MARADAQLPERLSRLLLALYAACDGAPVDSLQREALRLLQGQLEFDSAFWAAGVLDVRQEPVILTVCLFNQPQEMLASYERVKHLDTILARAVAQFGTTIRATPDEEFSGPDSEAMKAHGQRFGIRQVLATMTRGPVSQLMGAVSLYRSDPEQPFSEEDRMLAQCLAPHLVALWDRNRMQHVEASLRADPETRLRGVALISSDGMLYNASPLFVELMREQWPDWRGPFVPSELLARVRTVGGRPIRLSRVAVHVSRVSDLLLLRLRRIGACDGLTEREWEVATSFADGLTHKEIAGVLHIAPSTVRNHLRAIYEKIGVGNKAELIRSLAAAPR